MPRDLFFTTFTARRRLLLDQQQYRSRQCQICNAQYDHTGESSAVFRLSFFLSVVFLHSFFRPLLSNVNLSSLCVFLLITSFINEVFTYRGMVCSLRDGWLIQCYVTNRKICAYRGMFVDYRYPGIEGRVAY
jgi:hypothetical protein